MDGCIVADVLATVTQTQPDWRGIVQLPCGKAPNPMTKSPLQEFANPLIAKPEWCTSECWGGWEGWHWSIVKLGQVLHGAVSAVVRMLCTQLCHPQQDQQMQGLLC